MVLPKYELERLEALRRCNILDTFPEIAFDELTFLASQICRAPVALVAMVDEGRCWFKSRLGLAVDEVPNDFSLCAHAILKPEVFTVRDALKDHRFSHNTLVATDPKLRFYAGTPLITPDGFAVGTLCVMDYVPRTLSKNQLNALSILGHQGSRLIALRHKDGARLLESKYDSKVKKAEPAESPSTPRRNALLRLSPALAQNELTIHFQPKIELGSKRVTGFEALVRWLHPSLGFILPGEFIPLAETSGQIAMLTPWVLDQTLERAYAAGWPDRGLQVAVNLSARNLQDAGLPRQISGILKHWSFPPHFLTLEITESAVMSDFNGALAILNQLREIGVSLSVDDFGTGHSSLAYLKELPLQEMKIDRALVTNVHRCDRDSAIVKFTVDLGHNLGMSVVGEGVEEPATLQALTELGCDGAQGYAIGRPMRPEDIGTWLNTH